MTVDRCEITGQFWTPRGRIDAVAATSRRARRETGWRRVFMVGIETR